ncbi:MAG: FAD-dependent oxidoreductase [Planctomycetaceae bacterium]|nr:FAD-dependent oxidoreductase [Planctomycetaceae bacterium]
MNYDIAVIGNDEAAFEMLCLAARGRRRAVSILPETRHSAWIVGQSLRRLVSSLLVDRTVGRRKMLARSGSPKLLRSLVARAVSQETNDHVRLLESLGVEVLVGEARFTSSKQLTVSMGTVCRREFVSAQHIVIGTGVRRTAMHRRLGLIPFHTTEALLSRRTLPKEVCFVGGGDVGAGMAALVSLFGVRTSHVARTDRSSVLLELAEASGVTIGTHPADVGLANFESPLSQVRHDVVDCRKSVGFSNHLSLNVIGVEPDEHGQLWCASNFETWCPGVFGIGDVVGFSPDTALHPSVQADRIMHRILHSIRRPHFAEAFLRRSEPAVEYPRLDSRL